MLFIVGYAIHGRVCYSWQGMLFIVGYAIHGRVCYSWQDMLYMAQYGGCILVVSVADLIRKNGALQVGDGN